VDGVKTVTLKGAHIAADFQRIVEQYVIDHYSGTAAGAKRPAADTAHA
jgi:hypothetical protein